jgi:hypothetical protein
MTNDETLKIFKKYDPTLYEYYINNAHLMSYNARNYAELLKNQNSCITCKQEINSEYFEGVNGRICAKCLKEGGAYYALKSENLIKIENGGI